MPRPLLKGQPQEGAEAGSQDLNIPLSPNMGKWGSEAYSDYAPISSGTAAL